jgi:hypothetical protein
MLPNGDEASSPSITEPIRRAKFEKTAEVANSRIICRLLALGCISRMGSAALQ